MRRVGLDRILIGALLLALVVGDLLMPAMLIDLTFALIVVLAGYVIARPTLVRSAGRWARARRRPARRTVALVLGALVVLASPFLIRDQSPLAFVPRVVGQAEDAALWSRVQLIDASFTAESFTHGSAGFPARGDALDLAKAYLLHARFDAAILALRSTAPPPGGKVLRLAIVPIYERISLAQTQLIAAEQAGMPTEIGLRREYLALLHGRLVETLRLLVPPAATSLRFGHLASAASADLPAAAPCPPAAATQTADAAELRGPVQLLRSAGADYLTPGLQIYGNSALNASALATYEAARSQRIAFLKLRQDALDKELLVAGDRLTHFDAAARQQDVTALLAAARDTRVEALRTAREEGWGVIRALPYIDTIDKGGSALGMSQDVIQVLDIGKDVVGTGYDVAAAGTAFGDLASSDRPARLDDYAAAAKVVVGASMVADKAAAYVALRGLGIAEVIKGRAEFFAPLAPWITAADVGFSLLTWAGAEYWADSADQTVHQLDDAHARVTDYRAVLSSAVAELELQRDANASELNALAADCTALASWRADLAPPAAVLPTPAPFVPTPAPFVPTPAPFVPTPAPFVPTPAQPALPIASVTRVAWSPCTTPAKGYLPGWINCPGTVTLQINRPVSSGFVTVVFDYPSSGSFFHGGLQVGSRTGTVTVPMINDYINQCVTSYLSTVTVRDGQFAGPVIASEQVALTASCQ